jgi:hypothetical protein
MAMFTNKSSMLSGATTVAAGAAVNGISGMKTYQAGGTTSAGAGAATIVVQGSNDDAQENWDDIGTISLTLGTTTTSDSFWSDDRYCVLRGNVTAISGTGASVNLMMGF